MSRLELTGLRRSIPTIAIAGALVVLSASSGATAALVITGKQIKDNTVTTKDIKNGSLVTKDLKASTVSGLRGATGPAGPAGAPGAPGAPGVSGYQIVTASALVAADSGGEVTASCPAGKRVLGAAAELVNSYDGTAVNINTVSAASATAYAMNYDPANADTLVLDLVCAVVA